MQFVDAYQHSLVAEPDRAVHHELKRYLGSYPSSVTLKHCSGTILPETYPSDLPVEQNMQFELVVNLKTAQALGLTLAPVVLFQADKIIR
jgi:hypothetical protein